MEPDSDSCDLVILESGALAAGVGASRPVPAIVSAPGDKAGRRFLEFFAVTIDNASTRGAYYRACRRFFAWCDARGLKELVVIEAMLVASIHQVDGRRLRKAERQAAPRCDPHAVRLARGRPVIATNPAHSVRGPKHVVKRGKTARPDGRSGTAIGDR